MVTIRNDIPVPPLGGGIASLLRRLKVGDSVLLSADRKAAADFHPYYTAAIRLGIKIAIRTVEGTRRRLWRIE